MKKSYAVLCICVAIVGFILTACDAATIDKKSPEPAQSPKGSSVIEPYIEDESDDTGNPNAGGSQSPSPTQDDRPDIAEYFPIYENVRMVYEGHGNEFAFFNAYIDYTADNRVQQRIDNGGSQLVRVIEVRDNAIVEVLFRGETYYRENLLKAVGDEEILLMEPLAQGTSWALKDGSTRKITSVSADVTVPFGSYKAIEVTTESEHGTTIDYYAAGVGLVKTVFKSEGAEISSVLSEIERDVPFVQMVNFYYPNVEDESLLLYESREIAFKTNDVTRMILEQAYKAGSEDLNSPVFTKNTRINSLYLNKDGMVYIDLSKEYITEMSAGAGFELAMLQCIANTFGQYYHADRVLLTIDGELYSSGHIELEKGQYLEVNFEISKSIKD